MALLGQRNFLKVVREGSPGFYLDDGEGGVILLPGREAPKGTVPGDVLDVFFYLDSEDRPVVTLKKPLAMVGEFACLKVVSVNLRVGAFLDWGLPKDLLLPFREQVGPNLQPGDRVVVRVDLDTKSRRLVASMRLHRHLGGKPPRYERGKEVSVLIAARTPLGYSAVVENAYSGLLYHSNLSGPLEIGQEVKAFVHGIRPDGKIDLRLDASGYQRMLPLRGQILEALECNKGRLEFDDKSPPEAIRREFGASKNAFKLALSALYKERRVIFRNGGTELVAKKRAAS